MCLTIPKKVISTDGNSAVVKNPSGGRQEVKSIIKVKAGDFVLTQQNVIIQKISKKQADELISMIKSYAQ